MDKRIDFLKTVVPFNLSLIKDKSILTDQEVTELLHAYYFLMGMRQGNQAHQIPGSYVAG